MSCESKLQAAAVMAPQILINEIKNTFKLGWPIICAQLLWLSFLVTDNLMVANLGKIPLASMAMASGLATLLNVALIGIMAALSPMVSHAFGANQPQRIGDTMRQGIRISLILSVIEIVLLCFSKPLLELAGQDPNHTFLAQEYLRAIAWGAPASILFVCFRHLTEGTGDSIPSMIIVAAGSLFNIFFNYALIYGNFGFPKLGLVGAGYSTSVTYCLITAIIILYIHFNPRYAPYNIFKGSFAHNRLMVRELFILGIPMGGAILAEMGFFVSTTMMAGILGVVELGSHQIALNAASFTFMIPLGLSFAVSIRIGHAYGKKDTDAIRIAGIAGILIGLTFNSISAALFMFFPDSIVGFYTKDPELVAMGVKLLKIAGIFQLIDGVQVVGMGMLRGLKETKGPFINTMIAFWLVGFPITLYITFKTSIGVEGLWYGMLIGLGIAAVAHQIRFFKIYNRLASTS